MPQGLRPITVQLLRAISTAAIAAAHSNAGDRPASTPIECAAEARAAAERVTHEFLDQLSTSAPAAMHVLVVDDDKFIRDTVSRMLGNCSYSVTVCDSGTKALEILALPNHNIDLIP